MRRIRTKFISILTTVMLLLSFLPFKTIAASDQKTSSGLPPQFQSPPAGSKDIVE
jgi:uncharacterized membrane protein